MAVAPRPPGPQLPAQWSFHAETIVGGTPLGPLNAHGFSCSRKLSGFGNGQITTAQTAGWEGVLGYVLLPRPGGGFDSVPRLLRLWSWKLWCLYDGQPVWCGVPTGLSDEGGDFITITLAEITGYLARRQWDHENRVYSQAEQTQIARDIAQPLEDVGVTIITEPGEGYPRDRAYEYLESDHRGQLLTNLAEVIGGPQFRSEYTMTPAGQPHCTLRIGYPRVGTNTELGVTVPGSGTDYDISWDSDFLRTRTFAAGELPEGAPDGTPKPVAVIDAPQDDLPRLDMVDDWPSTFLLSTLNERALAEAERCREPALELDATAGLDDPPVTAYNVGDDVTISIVTPFVPGGIEDTGVLTEVTISAGEQTANWEVALDMPAPRPRERLVQRLDRIDTTIARINRRGLAPQ